MAYEQFHEANNKRDMTKTKRKPRNKQKQQLNKNAQEYKQSKQIVGGKNKKNKQTMSGR